MYHWTDDMIRFMTDASAYGNYHRKLAEIVLPYLEGTTRLCDAGCGLGDLSIALSPSIPEITAIDIKPQAINVLSRHCTERNISNIRTINHDIHSCPPPEPYDGMVFRYFGRSEDILNIAGEQCRGTVVVIKKNYSRHRFSVGNYPTGHDDYTHMQTILQSKKIPFENRRISLEFGQPFRCFEDVRTFFKCYSRDEDPSVLTDEFLYSKVIQTGKDDFPLYMPHRRESGIICFRSEDLQ